MAHRFWRYYLSLQLRHGRPVLSSVLYRRGGAPGPRWESHEERVLDRPVARLDYLAFGLAGCPAAHYLDLPEPLAWGLAALMRSHPWSRVEHKLLCMKRIANAELGRAQRFLLVNFVETYLQLNPSETAEYVALRRREDNREVEAMELTWAEKMEAKGMERGIERGMERGVAQGMRRTILRLLASRFGPLSEDVTRRVEALPSLGHLERLADHLLTARSLDELGLGEPPS